MSVYVIRMWIYGSDRFTDPPDSVIGPFTEAESKRLTARLTCANDRQLLSRRIPEWALS